KMVNNFSTAFSFLKIWAKDRTGTGRGQDLTTNRSGPHRSDQTQNIYPSIDGIEPEELEFSHGEGSAKTPPPAKHFSLNHAKEPPFDQGGRSHKRLFCPYHRQMGRNSSWREL